MLPSAAASAVVSNSSTPPLRKAGRITCTPLTGRRELPVEIHCAGREFPQRVDPGGLRAPQLADQIVDQFHLTDAGPDHGRQVARPDRPRQIADMAVFKEFRRPPGERPEQQPWLAVDDSRVQVCRRHRRCTRRG